METIARKENLLLVSTDVDANDDADFDMQIGMIISATESALINQLMDAAPVIGEYQSDQDHYNHDEQMSAVLTEVSRSLDPLTFAQDLTDRCTFSKIASSIGLMSSDPNYVIGAVHSDQPKGVSAEYLAKIFRIDLTTAKNTLDVTNQRVNRSADPTLSVENQYLFTLLIRCR